MRGIHHNSPLLGLFFFALVFLMLAHRGVHLVVSAVVACIFSMGAMYCLLALREADKQGLPFTTALHFGLWAKAARKQLQSAAWVVAVAMCALLVMALLTGRVALS